MLTSLLLFAQDATEKSADTGANPQGSPLGGMLLPLLFIIPLFWFLMIRPMKKQEAQRKALLSGLEKGDKVLTNGGIIGYVVSANDDELVVRIDENVKVKMVKSGIAQNLTKLELLNQPKSTEK
jgi:preprotein translocase subunit YajC